MKTAANNFNPTQSEPSEPSSAIRWEGVRYAIVAVIIATISLLASLMPDDASAFAFQVGPGFALFWLAGGCTTLVLLTRAARKPV